MRGTDYITGYKKKRKQALNKKHYKNEIESYIASENQIKTDIDYHNPLPIEQQVPDNFLKGKRLLRPEMMISNKIIQNSQTRIFFCRFCLSVRFCPFRTS